MRSPSPAKGGKNKLKRRGYVKKIFTGQGAAKPKNQKKEISRETIEKFLFEFMDDALPKTPCLPLNPRQKKEKQDMRKVMRSIGNLRL
jgi:hypothetical protein